MTNDVGVTSLKGRISEFTGRWRSTLQEVIVTLGTEIRKLESDIPKRRSARALPSSRSRMPAEGR